ncbi:MAG TPA: asparagine synthase (glutamine-hydrolyzing) [Polyangia bacterium]|nr:asparagine synthase (glutamine-hydrolyzing) [Polyangia bacterium]
MCGIYGFAAHENGALGEAGRWLAAMDRAIVHRGPDDSGTYVDGRCAMGMRRLSIIDLDGGRQPISNESGDAWVVFNGEIYNYRALRSSLEARGHRFATSSDTEVIVHLYEEHGDDLVEALDGMFAFALWDRPRGRLLLARDRLGIKPLYWAETRSGLVFGSELKSLIEHPEVSRAVSPEALSHYLSFGTTPQDRAILDGVRKLPPAHLLTFERGRVRTRRWWDLRPVERPTVSFEDAALEVRRLIRAAVKSHLVSDVPVGAFLSGGVDSATVVGTMVELGAHPKTFSIGFDDPDFDELDPAKLVARHFRTDHHELVVKPDAWALVNELTWFLDEPFADVSAIPTYLVSKLAAQHVKVVLSGDGGDEVFAGYDHYPQALAEARRLDGLPDTARALLGVASAVLPQAAPGKHWLRHASLEPRVRFIDGESLFPADLKARLVGGELAARLMSSPEPLDGRARLLDGAPGDALGRLLYYDTMTYLPLDILTKVDRMTMAHSLEARPPLLDHHLVEAVFALPSAHKLSGVTQKAVLKRAVADLVPQSILARPKRGFGVPIRAWFRGPLKDAVVDVLTDSRTRARGWLEPRFVRALCEEHFSGRRDQSVRMWGLLMLELWCRRFLDGAQAHESRVPEYGGAHG